MCQKDNGSPRWELATMVIRRNNSFAYRGINSANVTAQSSGSVVLLCGITMIENHYTQLSL